MTSRKQHPRTPDPWLSVGQAARQLGCAKATVYAMIARGELRHQIVATRTFVDRGSVNEAVQDRGGRVATAGCE